MFAARTPAYTTVDLDVRVPLGWAGLNDDTFFQLNVTNVFDKFYVGNFSGALLGTTASVRADRRAARRDRHAGGSVPLGRRSSNRGAPRPGRGALLFVARDAYARAMTSDSLVEQARAAALRAYAPYSRFSVGCAVESVDGEIVVGANMENACYRLGICAEISALTAARQAFGLDKVARIAVAGGHVGAGRRAGRRSAPVTPCGGCRQAIYEAARPVRPRHRGDLGQRRRHRDDRQHDPRRCFPHGFGPAQPAPTPGGEV